MTFTDGIKAVKEERRVLVRRLKQIDSILNGFSQLSSRRPRKAGGNSKPVRAKRGRKQAKNNVIVASKGASLAAAAQD